jgi:multidrug efflux pump subunit AcrB
VTRIVCVALATIAGTVGCRSEAARQQLSLQVLAAAPGMSASDVELYVTRPLEVGLSGIAGEVGVRSTREAGPPCPTGTGSA